MHSKTEKCFLQACINHGCLERSEVMAILMPICNKYHTDMPENSDGLQDFVKNINKNLKDLNQSLTFIKHGINNKEYLVFAVTLETDIGKKQAHLTEMDRYFFTQLIEALVKQTDYSIHMNEVPSVMSDPNISSQQQKMQNTHMFELLQLWIHQGYFLKVDHNLYIGPRLLVEFAGYLKKHYSDMVQDCTLCSKLVLWDVDCTHCHTKMHRSCIRRYLIKNSNCPSCNKTWNTRLSV